MKHLILASVALLTVSAALSSAALAGPELITNGTFAGGSNTGWSATKNVGGGSDTVEVHTSGTFGLPDYNGQPYNMEVNANAVDTVTQVVSGLVVGDYYVLSFGYGGRSGAGPQAMTVSFGGTLLGTDCSDISLTGCSVTTAEGSWTTNTFVIEATSATETLSFASIFEGGLATYGNEISDVTLIPEPASLAMLVIGLTGIGVLRRRRA